MVVKKMKTSDYLKNNGIRPSHQRIRIYDYLVEKKNHPSVDQIFRDLRDDIPTLSKTTVYNTLKEFYKNKLVISLSIDENETRFDADTSIHGHFICENCGHIYDFKVDDSMLESELMHIAEIKEHHLYLKGTCKDGKCKTHQHAA